MTSCTHIHSLTVWASIFRCNPPCLPSLKISKIYSSRHPSSFTFISSRCNFVHLILFGCTEALDTINSIHLSYHSGLTYLKVKVAWKLNVVLLDGDKENHSSTIVERVAVQLLLLCLLSAEVTSCSMHSLLVIRFKTSIYWHGHLNLGAATHTILHLYTFT
jgi:hypothetical protein